MGCLNWLLNDSKKRGWTTCPPHTNQGEKSAMQTLKEIASKVGTGVKSAATPLTDKVEDKLNKRAGTAAYEANLAQIGAALRDDQKRLEAEAKAQRAMEEANRLAVESAAASATAAEMIASIRLRLNEVAEMDASLITSSLEVLLKESKAADKKRGEV